jgi:Ca2+-binding RTX toxin-like protein
LENLTLTGSDAIDGFGNMLKNTLIGNAANNTLNGDAGADKLTGGGGSDFLNGGLGKDVYILTETTPATDTLHIAAGDSLVSAYDMATGFSLGTDKLDLDSTLIAANATAVNGINSGIIHSHHIVNGLISFDDVNSYNAPITLASSD